MFSENFMRYLIAYQTDEMEPSEPKKDYKCEKKPLMVDLIGVKYATIPIRNTAK